jgi:type IV secretion system protein VirB11
MTFSRPSEQGRTATGKDPAIRLPERLSDNLGSVIMALLQEENVNDILLNPDGRIWVNKNGEIKPCGHLPRENSEMVLSLMATALGGVVTAEQPIVEGELPLEGSRFEGLMPPLVAGPSFTIRKKPSRIYTLEEYDQNGTLPPGCLDVIREAIKMRRNIMVSGGTGSGKTTFVNAIIHGMAELCPAHRLAVIEDTAELQPASENVITMRTSDFVDIKKLVEVTMRLRPDRILVGEVRNGAALEVLKAWNTGHPGGTSTIHANSARHTLSRLEQLILEVSESPMRQLVGEAIDLVVFLKSTPQGRVVEELAEVDYDEVSNQYLLNYYVKPRRRTPLAATNPLPTEASTYTENHKLCARRYCPCPWPFWPRRPYRPRPWLPAALPNFRPLSKR